MINPKNDLAEIKAIMERSTRFLTLSGLSGVLAGLFALAGALLAYYWVYYPNTPFGYRNEYITEPGLLLRLFLTAFLVLVASIVTVLMLTRQKTKRSNTTLWTRTGRRFLFSLLVPLSVGGVFIMALILRGYFVVIAPACLVFYGLALLNASHFTLNQIRYLAYTQITLGLLSAFLPGYGLVFWAVGFGLMHIVYGIAMHLKYGQ